MTFLPLAGLVVNNVHPTDSGLYVVRVNTFDEHGIMSFHTEQKIVHLVVGSSLGKSELYLDLFTAIISPY